MRLRIGHEPDLAFKTGDLPGRGVVIALHTVDFITRLVVPAAGVFKLSLHRSLRGQTRFGLGFQRGHLLGDPSLFGQRLVASDQPEHALLELAIGLERAELPRDFGLFLELVDLRLHLAQDVFDPGQVFAGV